MATKHTSTDRPRKKLAALAISAMLFAACGSTSQALSGTAQNEERASVVRDPENPYWQMSKAPAGTYADPVHGDH
jgi:hypothetical protein